MLTVIAATEYELAGLRPQGEGPGALPWDLQVVGVGRREASASVRRLLERRPVAAGERPVPLLLLGFAGAVDPALRSGDLVLSSRYYREGPAGDYASPDPVLQAHAVLAADGAGLAPAYVDSLTTDRLIATPQEKLELKQRYPVGVVNMEDYWIGAAAREAGASFLSARVVLDTARQSLPRYLVAMGKSRTRAVWGVVAAPWRIPALVRLARQLPAAQEVLGAFALSFAQVLDRAGTASEAALEPAAVPEGFGRNGSPRNGFPREASR